MKRISIIWTQTAAELLSTAMLTSLQHVGTAPHTRSIRPQQEQLRFYYFFLIIHFLLIYLCIILIIFMFPLLSQPLVDRSFKSLFSKSSGILKKFFFKCISLNDQQHVCSRSVVLPLCSYREMSLFRRVVIHCTDLCLAYSDRFNSSRRTVLTWLSAQPPKAQQVFHRMNASISFIWPWECAEMSINL